MHSIQIFSMFGSGYVPEHTDEPAGNLTPTQIDDAVTSLTVLMFSEMMRSLKTALSVKPGRLA